MPFFPNPKLREKAYEANDAWWKLEQEYGALRTEEQKKFPVLAMYSDNEAGDAAERLDALRLRLGPRCPPGPPSSNIRA